MIDVVAAEKLGQKCYRCKWPIGGRLCGQITRFVVVSGRRKYARLCPGHEQLAARQ